MEIVQKKPFYKGLTFQVFFAMGLGVVVGLLFPDFGKDLKILGDIFLRLIKTAVAPLVFLTVVQGIASAGDIKSVGKIGFKSLIYFEVVSTIALILGLIAANVFSVGSGLNMHELPQAEGVPLHKAAEPFTFKQFMLDIFPDNFIGAFASGHLLQVLVIALIFGFAILALEGNTRVVVEESIDKISQCLFKFIDLIMKFAPIGAFGALAFAVGSNGTDVLISLINLVGLFYLTLIIFVVVVLGTICKLYGFNLFNFLKYIKEEIALVFGTASSESALPRLLRKLNDYGCTKQSVGLILPTGYAFNLDGTSIYMSMGVIFLANAYGVPLSLEQQLGIIAIMLLTSKGAATVSGGSFVVFAATVTATGVLPLEGLAILFGVYRLMSIGIATTNTIGNSVATIVVSKSTGNFTEQKNS